MKEEERKKTKSNSEMKNAYIYARRSSEVVKQLTVTRCGATMMCLGIEVLFLQL